MIIYSIGYQCHGALFDIIKEHGAKRLLDVRLSAWSHSPRFRSASMSRICASIGIEYIHAHMLGNPHKAVPAHERESSADHHERIMSLYRQSLEQRAGMIKRVAARLRDRDAIMCACRHHDRCHRGVLFSMIQAACAAADRGLIVERLGEAPRGQRTLF
jgi:uncharacterized protein (DUF488 family)